MINYEIILRDMKKDDNYYCFSCNSYFNNYIIINVDNKKYDGVSRIFLCPFCYERGNSITREFLEKQLINENNFKIQKEFILNDKKIKIRKQIILKNFRKIIILLVLIVFFPISILLLSFIIHRKLQKRFLKKRGYFNRYNLYGVD